MSSLAEQLMAGPRGRRVCLQAARFADERAAHAGWGLDFELDPSPGKGWLTLDGSQPPPQPIAPLMRAQLSALSDVATISEHAIHLALEDAVDSARYWQAPDGTEVLASRAELGIEIRRFAEIIEGAETTRWWAEPIDVPQFEVRLGGWSDGVVVPSAAESLESWHEELVREERRAALDRPTDPTANYGGTWWSYPPHQVRITCSAHNGVPTGLYLVEDGYGETIATAHRVSGAGRVLEIDSGVVWAGLCCEHPLEVTASKRHDWYRTTGLADTRWIMPDWASVAQEYDAVHLQVGAYLAASGTAIEVEPGVHSVIAGWAPGDTFWLTDVVEVEPRGRIFVKDQGDDLWHAEEE